MDCKKCSIMEECRAEKEHVLEQYVEDLREPLRKELERYCPLFEVAETAIARHAQNFIRDYRVYMYMMERLSENEK